MGKGEIARNKQFLLFPVCFLSVWRTFCHFQVQNCRLQTLSVWKSLKFVVWERVKNILQQIIIEKKNVHLSICNNVLSQCLLSFRTFICRKYVLVEWLIIGNSSLVMSSLFTRRQSFSIIQIESICRLQNKCVWKVEICFWNGRTHCKKKNEKMLVTSIFSFSHNVFNTLLFYGR